MLSALIYSIFKVLLKSLYTDHCFGIITLKNIICLSAVFCQVNLLTCNYRMIPHLLRSAVGMTHDLRSDLWWTIPLRILLGQFWDTFWIPPDQLCQSQTHRCPGPCGSRQMGHVVPSILVPEPDHFSVPKGGTNSCNVFCKDHTLKCSKPPTGPLYIVAYGIFYAVLYVGSL